MRRRGHTGASARAVPARGFRLGRLAGIELRIDWSLLIAFWLIASSLAFGLFPAWHPGWTRAQMVGTALVSALVFFASVLAHELAHAIVGRKFGIHIGRITLFVFGGIAELGSEPRNWRAELAMAFAGPLVSIGLGAVFLLLATASARPLPESTAQIEPWLAGLGSPATLLLWLGQVNVVLALFNLVPGFPLDGGRVLRAVLWGLTGNVRRATRWASLGGQAFAWMLILFGVSMILGADTPLFGSGPVGGLWLVFIGWFLHNAALMSYRQLLSREALAAVSVGRLMRTDFLTLPPDASVARFVEEYLLPSGQRAFPVVAAGRLRGLVSLKDARRIDRDEWPATTVARIMTPLERLVTAAPGEGAFDALVAMGQAGVDQLPVLESGVLRGLLRREDVLNWLALYGERGDAASCP